MNTRTFAFAALAAGALTLAHAQSDNAVAPAVPADVGGTAVQAATASGGSGYGVANSIAEAINGDESLKGVSVEVKSDKGEVTLAGNAPTVEQLVKIDRIAASYAGPAHVVDSITTPDQIAAAPEPSPAALASASTESLSTDTNAVYTPGAGTAR